MTPADDGPASQPPRTSPTRSRRASLAFLIFGGAVALWLGTQTPREQSVRFVLGDHAADVRALEIAYVSESGESVREARFGYPELGAPRVVAHAPSLTDGTYRVRIDVETREGRRRDERQVRLSGGVTQVDLASLLSPTISRP